MKKIAIIAALTLAIGASMTAGTMARYTQNLGTKNAEVTTKKFNVEIDQFKDISFNVKPGDVVSEEIKLNTKDVETDMTLTIDITDITDEEKQLLLDLSEAGAKISITNNVDASVMAFEEFVSGHYQHLNVPAGVENVEYTVKLDWSTPTLKDDDAVTQKVQGKNLNFKIRVYAAQ